MSGTSILIAYFSHAGQNYANGTIVNLPVGNTEVVARKLGEITGGELLRIEQRKIYPEDYHKLTDVAKQELREGARPELKTSIPDMSRYDLLLLGYPNWWGTMPMAVWTFLETIDTRNKKIAPFCTNEGSGMGSSEKDLRNLCPEAEILRGLPIPGHEAARADAAIEKWARGLGLIRHA